MTDSDTITLSRAAYEGMIEQIEDFEDMLALERARNTSESRRLPHLWVKRLLDGEHPLRVWRDYRQLTGQQLESLSGVPQSYISDIERDVKAGSARTLQKLARALDIAIEDIMRD